MDTTLTTIQQSYLSNKSYCLQATHNEDMYDEYLNWGDTTVPGPPSS